MGAYTTAQKLRFASKMRRNPSYPEKKLWDILSKRKWARAGGDPDGICLFETQALILGWIVDFYCPERMLVIEIDGGAYHDPQADRHRDSVMRDAGYTVVRFTAKEIVNHFDFSRVVAKIKTLLLDA